LIFSACAGLYSTDPLAGFKGPSSKRREGQEGEGAYLGGKGRKGKGREGREKQGRKCRVPPPTFEYFNLCHYVLSPFYNYDKTCNLQLLSYKRSLSHLQ